MLALGAAITAGSVQAATTRDVSVLASGTTWGATTARLLGERQTVGATALWAQTVTDYADGRVSAEQVDRRVQRCMSLDPTFTTPARLGALMVSTLPSPDVAIHRRILRRGANAQTRDSWFARAMFVSLAQDETAPADLVTAWQHRAAAEASWR